MKAYILAFLLTSIVGTGLHFLYELYPLPLFGVLAPVSESVWEHLKLLLWPFLIGSLSFRRRDATFWGNVCISILVMPPVLLGIYYTILAGFGVESLAVDVGLYYVTIALGFLLLRHTERAKRTERQAGILIMLVSLWACALFILSMKPMDLPIFRG